MDGSRIRKEIVADSKISGYVWTGPMLLLFLIYLTRLGFDVCPRPKTASKLEEEILKIGRRIVQVFLNT